jgi:hypothetical protein
VEPGYGYRQLRRWSWKEQKCPADVPSTFAKPLVGMRLIQRLKSRTKDMTAELTEFATVYSEEYGVRTPEGWRICLTAWEADKEDKPMILELEFNVEEGERFQESLGEALIYFKEMPCEE